MAVVVPFASGRSGRIPQALTESRMRTISGLEQIRDELLAEAYEDLQQGMPYVDTDLRLLPRTTTTRSVVDAAVTKHARKAFAGS